MDEIQDVKLRGSGQIISLSRLPDSIIDVLYEVFRIEKDPYTVLASWAYIFTGMSIDEIRTLFILTDFNKTRIASREYIRQKIKSTYTSIRDCFAERHGGQTIATLYDSGNLPAGGGRYMELITNEEDSYDGNEEEASGEEGKEKRQKGARCKKAGARTKGLPIDNCGEHNKRHSTKHRPGI